jgi:hypothetical protein
VASLTARLAALWSMQGTKKEWPTRNFAQLILYVTVSIFIGVQHYIHLQEF